jgi:uncharacterized protein
VATAQTPVPASPTRWATDTAGFLSPGALQVVDRQLEDFERTSGNQVLVWIGTTTGGVPLEDWTIKAFEQWKVGRKGLDNGVIFFVFATDRRARIEVGYGLEGKVPDIIASRILNDVVIPRIKTGDRDGAVLQGVAALTAAVAGTPQVTGQAEAERPVPEWARPTETPPGLQVGQHEDDRLPRPQLSVVEMLVIGVVGLAFLILFITNPQLAIYLLINILASGRGGSGGSSSGGGGFSGGGGRGGGGGASGSW